MDESVDSDSGSKFLNTVQLQRALDDGCDAFYVHVTLLYSAAAPRQSRGRRFLQLEMHA